MKKALSVISFLILVLHGFSLMAATERFICKSDTGRSKDLVLYPSSGKSGLPLMSDIGTGLRLKAKVTSKQVGAIESLSYQALNPEKLPKVSFNIDETRCADGCKAEISDGSVSSGICTAL